MTDWIGELTDRRRWVRRRAACALSKMPHVAVTLKSALENALSDQDRATREWASEALRRAVQAGLVKKVA